MSPTHRPNTTCLEYRQSDMLRSKMYSGSVSSVKFAQWVSYGAPKINLVPISLQISFFVSPPGIITQQNERLFNGSKCSSFSISSSSTSSSPSDFSTLTKTHAVFFVPYD